MRETTTRLIFAEMLNLCGENQDSVAKHCEQKFRLGVWALYSEASRQIRSLSATIDDQTGPISFDDERDG